MAKKRITTNAMRMLDKAKIEYETLEYEADEVGDNFGVHTAEKLGLSAAQTYKTLVVRGDKHGVMVCCIPADRELDLKKIAACSGNKKAEMIHLKELLPLTGYIRGGVSPIGMKKDYPTYIDEACKGFEKIAVSAGVCGRSLMMNVCGLLKFTNARVCDITK
jgi:Cys-tRNA(Pro)/Cys-tRNA(Cys) deacylase